MRNLRQRIYLGDIYYVDVLGHTLVLLNDLIVEICSLAQIGGGVGVLGGIYTLALD